MQVPATLAAELSGTVSDEGEPLPMAEVMLIDADSRVQRGSQFSASDGGFRFSVPAGRYHLGVSKEEYADVWLRDIEVGTDDVVRDVELQPEAFADSPAAASGGSDDCD